MRNLENIDFNRQYEGYIWMSNQEQAVVINIDKPLKEQLPELSQINPFIVEGMLTDKKEKSYMIKYVDGEQLINEYDLSDKNSHEEICYAAHRLRGVKKLYFRQYWREVEDSLCENMPVLQPTEMVFVGFNSEKN